MSIRIKIAASIMAKLRAYHLAEDKRVEALSYIWAFATYTGDVLTVYVPHHAPLKLFAPDCFEHQSSGNVRLAVDVLNGMLVQFAASPYNCLINIHDHWFDQQTQFSSVDDRDDVTFDTYLRTSFEPMLVGRPDIGPARAIHNVAIVIAQDGVDARLVDTRKASPFETVSSVHVIGDHFCELAVGPRRCRSELDERFSRQRDFISPDQQAILADMNIVLVGAGGLGSIIAESLGRVGVGGITLIDNDVLDESNLNRWQGGMPENVGQPKAEVLARRLREMFPGMRVNALSRSVYDPLIEPALALGDAIIGGLDNDEARYFLNRVSVQYSLPLFDVSVAVTGCAASLDFETRFIAVLPGTTACMECTQIPAFNNKADVMDAFLDEPTRNAKRAAGYVIDVPDITAPSVYFLNQLAASVLVTEFLNYVCGWRPTATMGTERWRRAFCQRLEEEKCLECPHRSDERNCPRGPYRVDRRTFPETPHPECPTCSYYAGAGSTEALPRPGEFRTKTGTIFDIEYGADRVDEGRQTVSLS